MSSLAHKMISFSFEKKFTEHSTTTLVFRRNHVMILFRFGGKCSSLNIFWISLRSKDVPGRAELAGVGHGFIGGRVHDPSKQISHERVKNLGRSHFFGPLDGETRREPMLVPFHLASVAEINEGTHAKVQQKRKSGILNGRFFAG